MLRTIFEAECSLSPTEGILGKEQPLEVLKTSALNHIPTGWTLWMFVWVHVYVCVSFYKPECVWTDVISLLTTSCVTLHACLFLLGCHKLSCRLWSAITSEMSLHFVRLKVDGVWRDDAVLLCFIYAGVSACRLFFLFLGFFLLNDNPAVCLRAHVKLHQNKLFHTVSSPPNKSHHFLWTPPPRVCSNRQVFISSIQAWRVHSSERTEKRWSSAEGGQSTEVKGAQMERWGNLKEKWVWGNICIMHYLIQ